MLEIFIEEGGTKIWNWKQERSRHTAGFWAQWEEEGDKATGTCEVLKREPGFKKVKGTFREDVKDVNSGVNSIRPNKCYAMPLSYSEMVFRDNITCA